jgi:Zn-finger nucleic acid-binding protein
VSSPYRDNSIDVGNCPRCTDSMLWRRIGNAEIAECPRCNGLFVKQETMRQLILEKSHAVAELFVEAFGAYDKPQITWAQRPTYLKCPGCNVLMTRTQFAKGAKVIVDICPACGVWFDAGEFPLVVAFVMDGGLERSAARIATETAKNAKAQSLSGAQLTTVNVSRFTHSVSVDRKPLAPQQTAAVWSMFELLVKPR